METEEKKHSSRSKQARRETIQRLVTEDTISTQTELSRRLEEKGFHVTQATISRDIRELGLIKTADGSGSYHYELGKPAEDSPATGSFYSLFETSVIQIDSAENLVVIHTYTGMAQAVCATMDRVAWDDVLGTIAGDDTILVITRSEQTARAFADRLREI